jgi:hypothetical protein
MPKQEAEYICVVVEKGGVALNDVLLIDDFFKQMSQKREGVPSWNARRTQASSVKT